MIKGVEAKIGTPQFSGGLVRDNPGLFLMKRLGINLRNFLPLNDPIAYKGFKTLFKKLDPDIVHGHNIITFSMAPFLLSKELEIPTMITVHGYWPACPLATLVRLSDQKPCHAKTWKACSEHCTLPLVNIETFMRKLRSRIVANIDLIVTVSNYVKKRLTDFGYPKSMMKVIHNGVDVQKFKPIKTPSSPYLLHVGRLSYYKGTSTLFDVAEILESKYPEVTIKLIGGKIKKKKTGIENIPWVSFKKLIKLYSNAIGVITPSIRPEPFPLVPLEAMACGTPVVASKIGGLKESIEEGETGFLTLPGNANQIVEAIVQLYENTSLREKMGKKAREHIKENFSLQKMGESYVKTYKQLLHQ